MTKYLITLLSLVLFINSCSANDKEGKMGSIKEVKLTTTMDSISYALGVNLGTQLSQDSIIPNIDAIAMGISDAITSKVKMSEEARQMVIQTLIAQIQEKEQARQEAEMAKLKEAAPKNLAEGQKFLEENKKKSGVQVTASGLQYKIINPGNSKKPKASDEVTVHYKGTLIDNTIFDSSYERNQPATFPLNGVIPGWTEGLQLIGEGGKIILYIPADLGYGENGMGNAIPPNSVLIFEVELQKVGK